MFPANERRSGARVQSATSAKVKNLTQVSEVESAVILDVSRGGMRLESSLHVDPRDGLQLELPDSVLLGEVIYRQGSVFGIKFCHSLSRAVLSRCVQPELWAEDSAATTHTA